MSRRRNYPMRSVAGAAADDSGLIFFNRGIPSPVPAKQPAQAIDLFGGGELEDELEFALWALSMRRGGKD